MYQFCNMEISGEIKSIHVDQIRLVTQGKNQEIDIFYTDSKKFDVAELFERQKVVFSVIIQSVDYYNLKLGKLWLTEIISPAKSPRKSIHKGKGVGDRNWAETKKYIDPLID